MNDNDKLQNMWKNGLLLELGQYASSFLKEWGKQDKPLEHPMYQPWCPKYNYEGLKYYKLFRSIFNHYLTQATYNYTTLMKNGDFRQIWENRSCDISRINWMLSITSAKTDSPNHYCAFVHLSKVFTAHFILTYSYASSNAWSDL
jgi:hypothetical protein